MPLAAPDFRADSMLRPVFVRCGSSFLASALVAKATCPDTGTGGWRPTLTVVYDDCRITEAAPAWFICCSTLSARWLTHASGFEVGDHRGPALMVWGRLAC
jgi:hypothetical protein